MEEERRNNSINDVLIGIGEMKGDIKASLGWLENLNTKVAEQNGRVGKLEKRNAFYAGAIAILSVITLPLIVATAPSILKAVLGE